jgi:GGDEF domain-containing protein
VRSSDVIGRLGGDEFALLLWNLSETDAHAKAAALEQDIDRLSFTFEGHTLRPAYPRALPFSGRMRKGKGAGGRRPRDVCAQGAAAARSLTRTFRKSPFIPPASGAAS